MLNVGKVIVPPLQCEISGSVEIACIYTLQTVYVRVFHIVSFLCFSGIENSANQSTVALRIEKYNGSFVCLEDYRRLAG